MERKEPSSATDDESTMKSARAAQLEGDMSRVTAVGCISFPEAVSRIVGDYLSGSEREYVVAALIGVQPITFCLSQDGDSQLGACWSLGFLPPERQWESWYVQVDKQFPITDVEGCLSFLNQTNSNDCRIAIEILVVTLSMTLSDSPSALNDLRNTIGELREHLSSVKHVVISLTEHFFCCFTLKNEPDKETGFSLPVDHQKVLLQMIDDLETCWSANRRTLTLEGLFAFYFTSYVQRASEMYLAKFVISLSHPRNRVLFKEEAPKMRSNKIMWVTSLQSYEDLDDIEPDAIRLCHFIRFDTSSLELERLSHHRDRLAHASFYQNNTIIERLVIKCLHYPLPVLLPRPSAPLTATTPLSALIELTLTGNDNNLHLTQLNNGYFPHLAHLTVIDGQISGHLDSDRVPNLKTLRLELGDLFGRDISTNYPLVHERAQSLIHAGRPWQLVAATKESGGWSLASYDAPALNPRNDEKEEASHSLPLIRELLLVIKEQSHVDEWHSQLRGDPSLEAAAGDHQDRLLVWAPQCVQKITAFCVLTRRRRLEFKEEIPGQTRTLASFTSYNVNVALDGNVLPNLQSLELNGGNVTISGAFPLLETLSFTKASLYPQWRLNAPLLQSLSCRDLRSASFLSLCPHLQPHLSFLRIELPKGDLEHCPTILVNKDSLALSRVKQIVFSEGMARSPFFEQCSVNNVLHLELTVSALQLPVSWYTVVWRCETLTINVIAALPELLQRQEPPDMVVLPLLPLVKKLTVTKQGCPVLLDKEMPKLADCTVSSPKSLGPNLKCPSLKRIRFTNDLSESDKKKCLDQAMYVAFGARPSEIIIAADYQLHTMAWDAVPYESQVLPSDRFL